MVFLPYTISFINIIIMIMTININIVIIIIIAEKADAPVVVKMPNHGLLDDENTSSGK